MVIALGSSVRVISTGSVGTVVTPLHSQPFQRFNDGVDPNLNVFYVLTDDGEIRLFLRDALEPLN